MPTFRHPEVAPLEFSRRLGGEFFVFACLRIERNRCFQPPHLPKIVPPLPLVVCSPPSGPG